MPVFHSNGSVHIEFSVLVRASAPANLAQILQDYVLQYAANNSFYIDGLLVEPTSIQFGGNSYTSNTFTELRNQLNNLTSIIFFK